MRFRLTIESDNAAFEEPAPEVARILREAADLLERQRSGILRDINGNRVGSFQLEADDDEEETQES